MLISLALFLVQEKEEKRPAPFYARIITPDEMQKGQSPRKPGQSQPLRRKNAITLPQLPQNLPPPVSRSSIPDPAGKKTDDTPAALSKKSGATLEQERQAPVPGIRETERKGPAFAPQPKTFREKLFDRDIIGKLAQEKKEDKKTDNRITLNTKGFKYYGYEQRAVYKIFDKWEVPLEYKYTDIAGEVLISYTIKKNGMIGNIELIRTSGHKSLDDAAIQAIKDAEPFWPLPEEWGENVYEGLFFFIYAPGPPGGEMMKFLK